MVRKRSVHLKDVSALIKVVRLYRFMAALMTLSWQFKELQVLLVKFLTTLLPGQELISFLVCQNAVTAMNFVTYVT